MKKIFFLIAFFFFVLAGVFFYKNIHLFIAKYEKFKFNQSESKIIADNNKVEKNLEKDSPSILRSTDRCGASFDQKYRNRRNQDISDNTAKIDCLFGLHPKTIGIGDGGNEIGMGNIETHISKAKTLVEYPTLSKVNHLIIASVSNWGGYGLLAALSIKSNRNLLPNVEYQEEVIKKTVASGAVDGFSGLKENKVDGKDLEENSYILNLLHELVKNKLNL